MPTPRPLRRVALPAMLFALTLTLGLAVPAEEATAQGNSHHVGNGPGNGPPNSGPGFDLAELGELHNDGLDYILSRTDFDAGVVDIYIGFGLSLADYLCDELAAGFPSGNLPGLGSRARCERWAAQMLFASERRGRLIPGTVRGTLDDDSREAFYLDTLDALIVDLATDRMDQPSFDHALQELIDGAASEDLRRGPRGLITVALSIGGSSARYWNAVRNDPTSLWYALAVAAGGDGSGPVRSSWPGIIRADIEAGTDAYNNGGSDHDILIAAVCESYNEFFK